MINEVIGWEPGSPVCSSIQQFCCCAFGYQGRAMRLAMSVVTICRCIRKTEFCGWVLTHATRESHVGSRREGSCIRGCPPEKPHCQHD